MHWLLLRPYNPWSDNRQELEDVENTERPLIGRDFWSSDHKASSPSNCVNVSVPDECVEAVVEIHAHSTCTHLDSLRQYSFALAGQ